MRPVIVPAILANSFEEVEDSFNKVKNFAPEVQIDIVDGKFAPTTTWPFHSDSFKAELMKLGRVQQDTVFEIDLMVEEPTEYLRLLKDNGFCRVIIHFSSAKDISSTLETAKKLSLHTGLAITNDDDLAEVEKHLDKVDWVQVMGIKEVGKQGEPFDVRTLRTIRKLLSFDRDLLVAVDGSVNARTLPDLLMSGARRLCVGSAILKSEEPGAVYKQLQKIVQR